MFWDRGSLSLCARPRRRDPDGRVEDEWKIGAVVEAFPGQWEAELRAGRAVYQAGNPLVLPPEGAEHQSHRTQRQVSVARADRLGPSRIE